MRRVLGKTKMGEGRRAEKNVRGDRGARPCTHGFGNGEVLRKLEEGCIVAVGFLFSVMGARVSVGERRR